MGLKYQSSFTSHKGLSCSLEIHAKDYSGDTIDIVLHENAVVHSWLTDEPKPAIKGSELTISIVNFGEGITALPITDFMASEDDFFKVIFKVGSDTKFEGYLVQDDYSEIIVDYPHEINLKATDNLGLLKDIPLGDAAITNGSQTVLPGLTIEQTAPDILKVTGTFLVSEKVVLIVDSGTALDGQYAVKTWQHTGGDTFITFESPMNGTVVGSMTATITHILPIDLSERMLLSELIALCFKATNLPLGIRVYGTIYPDGADDNRLFDNVEITPESFLSGTKWSSCYEVIDRIVGRLGYTLLQAEGFWNFVRWDELRLHANEIPGKLYDSDFVYDSDITLENVFVTGFEQDTFPEEGLAYTVQRPLKFDQETFNYRNPENIIRNIDFTEVGELLSTTTDGTDTIYDYRMVGWEQGFEWTTGGNGYIGSTAERIIRVRIDVDGNEKERWGVIRGTNGMIDSFACAQSNGVEVRPGDRVKYSFDFKTSVSQPGNVNNNFRVNLLTTLNPVPRSANNRYLGSDGKWNVTGPFILHNTPAGDNTNQWHSVSVESDSVPFAGLIIVKLAQCCNSPFTGKETHYKNIRFEVIRQISGSQKIIGHEHTSRQLLNIKNSQSDEIYVDSSPSNAIAGTLFLETFTGPVQDLVTTWNYNGDAYDKLGHITTRDELFWRRIPRLKLEGYLYQLEQDDKILSALSVMTYTQFSGSQFASGKLSIDYRQDKASLTMFEMYNSSEDDDDLNEIYGFHYLYEKT